MIACFVYKVIEACEVRMLNYFVVQPWLDDHLYQYTLPFNTYYFVVQPLLDDHLYQYTLRFNI